MKLSIYTFVKDGIYYDYHIVEMLKHHLPFADEIIVNEGFSTDGTYEAISAIDLKIKVFRTHWGRASSYDWYLRFKDQARQKCTGDWCILLDCDEFIPDWEFDRIRSHLERTEEDLIPVKMLNFYGSYATYHARPEKIHWPARKMIIHRNLPNVEVWGDGSNVRLKDRPLNWDSSSAEFTCHHFGNVRYAARLRQKWRNLTGILHPNNRKWFKLPPFLFSWLPHNWKDPFFLPDLALYSGPIIQAVQNNPEEFIRDRMVVRDLLLKEQKK